jgi:hypothetical protein
MRIIQLKVKFEIVAFLKILPHTGTQLTPFRALSSSVPEWHLQEISEVVTIPSRSGKYWRKLAADTVIVGALLKERVFHS